MASPHLRIGRRCVVLLAALLLQAFAAAADEGPAAPIAAPLPPRPALLPPETSVASLINLSAAPAPSQPGPLPWAHLHYPLAEPASGIDPYGWRWSDSRQIWRMHAGQDLLAPAGTPVLAMLPGRVLLVDTLDGYGLSVLLDHGGGWQSLYAHLSVAEVTAGAALPAGAPLGQVGATGRATAPHLHVELRRRSGDGMVAVDPTALLSEAIPALPQLSALP